MAHDDFGVKRVGIEWQGLDKSLAQDPAQGETILGSRRPGGRRCWTSTATFSAKSLGIEPQPIAVRLFVEDYLPGRERVYSPIYMLYVLNAEQHAIWVTEQLSKWHRHVARSPRPGDAAARDEQATSRAVGRASSISRRRAAGSRPKPPPSGPTAAGCRAWSSSGEDLVKQAMRNPEFGVGHLEKWAEMLQILKDISGNRMPSVADLLKQACRRAAGRAELAEQQGSDGRADPSPTSAGRERSRARTTAAAEATVPSIVDVESSQQPPKPDEGQQPPARQAASPRLDAADHDARRRGQKPSPSRTLPGRQKVEEAVASSRTCWPSSRRSPTN